MSEVDKSGAHVSSTERLYAGCLSGYDVQREITDPAPFMQWLESFPPDKTFGRGISDCALAKYSGQQCGYVSYGVGMLPDWAIAFVEEFIPREERLPTTVRRALEIMRKLV